MWRTNHRRDLERVAIGRVVASLEREGRTVIDLWYPDEQRADPRRAGRSTTPDAALRIDGAHAAIDVTTFWLPERARAAVIATASARQLKACLAAARLPFSLVVDLAYDPDVLGAEGRGVVVPEPRGLADAILAAVRGARAGDRIDVSLAGLPAWVRRVSVAVSEFRPGGATVYALPPRDIARTVPVVLEKIRQSKGAQLADWGLGIVVIAPRGIHETLNDVAAELDKHAEWPFWRVYWMDAADAHLAWARPPDAPRIPLPPEPAA